jgi:hypothetical protein
MFKHRRSLFFGELCPSTQRGARRDGFRELLRPAYQDSRLGVFASAAI